MRGCLKSGFAFTVLLLFVQAAAAQYLFNRADFAAGNGATSLVVGDFNGDGKVDLVVRQGGADSISVWLGNGDGTFRGGVTYATSAGPTTIASGDFNHDGNVDLAVTCTGPGSATPQDGTISVFLGN